MVQSEYTVVKPPVIISFENNPSTVSFRFAGFVGAIEAWRFDTIPLSQTHRGPAFRHLNKC